MNEKIAVVTSAGRLSGRITCRKTPVRAQPSIFAASSSSRGMPRMNWTIRKTKNASVARNCGTSSGRYGQSPIQPNVLEQDVLRDDQHVAGQQQGADHDGEPDAAQPEPQPGEGVRGEQAGDRVADDGRAAATIALLRKNRPKLTSKLVQPSRVVARGELLAAAATMLLAISVVRLERRADHPQQRVEHDAPAGPARATRSDRAAPAAPAGAAAPRRSPSAVLSVGVVHPEPAGA